MKAQRRLFEKWDWLILPILLLLTLLLFAMGRGGAQPTTVLVLYDGQVLEEISLPHSPYEKTYELEEGSVTVAFYTDGAAILSSDCPRQSCVEGGKITQRGSGSYCLPLRFAIVLEGEGGLDGVTG